MYRIVEKTSLNPTVTKMVVEAPLIAKKALPGQFVILRAGADSERIPLTVADYDREKGTVTVIFQVVGAGTMELNALEEGASLHDFVGPLGKASELDGLKKVCVVGGGVGCAIALPVAKALHERGAQVHSVDFVGPLGKASELDGLKKVCVVGGGVGCAIALPVAKALHERGAQVHSVVGFRNRDLVILEEEFRACSDKFVLMSDDGSAGEKGLVTTALEALIQAGEQYDEVIAIGPLVMMKFVVAVTKKYNVKTVVSMNPVMIDLEALIQAGEQYDEVIAIGPLVMMKFVVAVTKKYNVKTVVSMNPVMIDGTGMCGGCRLTVGGKTKFACVDGPEFDGFEVDFDEAIHRGAMYKDFEAHAREEACNLLNQEVR